MKRHVAQALSRLLARGRRASDPTRVVIPEGDYFERARQASPVLYAQWDTPAAPAEEDPEELLRERDEAVRAFYFGTEDDHDFR